MMFCAEWNSSVGVCILRGLLVLLNRCIMCIGFLENPFLSLFDLVLLRIVSFRTDLDRELANNQLFWHK